MCKYDGITGRLNLLYTESGLSIDKFAKHCQVSRSAMGNYLEGRIPETSIIIKICDACSVTSDWLLAMSDVRTPSADIQNAVKALGISEAAVLKLADPSTGHYWSGILSHMVENQQFYHLMTMYRQYLNLLKELKAEDFEYHLPEYQLDGNNVVLSKNLAVQYLKQEVTSVMMQICEKDYQAQFSQIDIPYDKFEASYADNGQLLIRNLEDDTGKE